jgi:hypothetical protein
MTAESSHNPNTMGQQGRDEARTSLNPAALAVADLAALLTKAGGVWVEAEQVRADIEAGAPTNADGSINLMHYAAWLVREMAKGGAGLGD